MANEARVTSSLTVQKRSSDGTVLMIDYQSRPTTFVADVDGDRGPFPGSIPVDENGVEVDFGSTGFSPSLCRIMNQSDTYTVVWGSLNSSSGVFSPIGDLLPGESVVIRLSQFLFQTIYAAGTGTAPGGDTTGLYLKALDGTANALVEAFER